MAIAIAYTLITCPVFDGSERRRRMVSQLTQRHAEHAPSMKRTTAIGAYDVKSGKTDTEAA